MNKEDLLRLRQQIVDQTKRLAMEGDTSPGDKLQVLMGIIRAGDSSSDIMSKAYETAQQLDEDTAKLDAYLDLIYEIDARLGEDSAGAPTSEEGHSQEGGAENVHSDEAQPADEQPRNQ